MQTGFRGVQKNYHWGDLERPTLGDYRFSYIQDDIGFINIELFRIQLNESQVFIKIIWAYFIFSLHGWMGAGTNAGSL